MRGTSILFLDFEKNKTHCGHKDTLIVNVEQYVIHDRADYVICKKTNKKKSNVTFTFRMNYLLKTGPDLLSFCSIAMFAPLFSKKKRKVQVGN